MIVATPEPLLTVRGLRASYGALEALHGIDFEIGRGESVVILGANGAGKTTTLRAVCRMVATRGDVQFDGEPVDGLAPSALVRRGIALVPQGRGTFADLSVFDNLRAGAYTRRDRGIDTDIQRWYELFPVLRERRNLPAGNLSGGEQQMLAVARAMLSRPKLLLLDEPSLGLAPLIVEELFATFRTVAGELGLSMLIVEQNAQLAFEVAQRAYVLEGGTVAMSGAVDDLRGDPAVRRAYLGL